MATEPDPEYEASLAAQATLTRGGVGWQLVALTAPMLVGHFAIVAFHLADTWFVAQLGTRELAALSFTFPVVMFIVSLALGLGMGTGAVVSQAIGEGDVHRVRRLTTDSLILSVLVVAVFSTVGILTIEPLFTLLGASPDVLPLIKRYMTVWYVGMVFVVVPMVGNNAIRARGDTTVPSLVMTVAAVINVVLDPLLIFGWGVIPRLGVLGAALATVIARATTLVVALLVLHFRDRMLSFDLPRFDEVRASWRRVLAIGVPAAGSNVLVPLSMGVLTRIVAGFGHEAVAAVGAGIRIEALALLVVRSLSAVMVPFVGQNWGAQRLDRVRAARTRGFAFALLWGLLAFAVLTVTARPLASLFSDEVMVIDRITRFLRIVPLGYGLLGVFHLATVILNAISKPLRAVALNVVRLFVLFIPLAWLGGQVYGFRGVLGGIAAANLVAGLAAALWIRSTLREAARG